MSRRNVIRSLVAVLFGAVFAALLTFAPLGKADKVGTVAYAVCAALVDSPTVATMKAEVAQLLDTYTLDSEEAIMSFAMTYACPEFKPLAVQAAIEYDQSHGGSLA